jgi:prophage maintenance system killer protein
MQSFGNLLKSDILEGNKGISAALVFLALNGIKVNNDEEKLVILTLVVATGKAGKSEIVEFFRSRPL